MKWAPAHPTYGDNMRTITENLRNRMVAEAEEAETQGLVKIAENLTQQIERNDVRPTDSHYIYSSEDFMSDVETKLWDVIVRTADFHGKHIDAAQAQAIVESVATEMVHEIRNAIGVEHGVGAFEPPVPGENKKEVLVSVDDDDE